MTRPLLVGLLIFALNACGFQLRGQANLPSAMATTYVSAEADLERELRLMLRGNGVTVTKRRSEASAVLSITNERLTREVQSVGERARVSEYALHYSLRFAVNSSAGDPIIAPQPIELVRDYTLDETQILGVATEEEIIRKEMRRDMANEILRRLAYAQ